MSPVLENSCMERCVSGFRVLPVSTAPFLAYYSNITRNGRFSALLLYQSSFVAIGVDTQAAEEE